MKFELIKKAQDCYWGSESYKSVRSWKELVEGELPYWALFAANTGFLPFPFSKLVNEFRDAYHKLIDRDRRDREDLVDRCCEAVRQKLEKYYETGVVSFCEEAIEEKEEALTAKNRSLRIKFDADMKALKEQLRTDLERYLREAGICI